MDVEGSHTRPADILLPNWEFGKHAALDFTITSALNPSTLNEASVMAGSAASGAEIRKHVANNEKCSHLGWVSRTGCSKSSAVSGLYGRLSIFLVRPTLGHYWLGRLHFRKDFKCMHRCVNFKYTGTYLPIFFLADYN